MKQRAKLNSCSHSQYMCVRVCVCNIYRNKENKTLNIRMGTNTTTSWARWGATSHIGRHGRIGNCGGLGRTRIQTCTGCRIPFQLQSHLLLARLHAEQLVAEIIAQMQQRIVLFPQSLQQLCSACGVLLEGHVTQWVAYGSYSLFKAICVGQLWCHTRCRRSCACASTSHWCWCLWLAVNLKGWDTLLMLQRDTSWWHKSRRWRRRWQWVLLLLGNGDDGAAADCIAVATGVQL